MNWKAKWLKPAADMGEIAPIFSVGFVLAKKVKKATLYLTAIGVYEADLNGSRVGKFILAPGWTSYRHRLQYQTYDVTDMLREDNRLAVTVGKGWYRSTLPGWTGSTIQAKLKENPPAVLAQLELTYEDGSTSTLVSDETWTVAESRVRCSTIYDGETYDATFTAASEQPAALFDGPYDTLIPQEGEEIREQERIPGAECFTTPKGETVIDFGQEVTGYVEISVDAGYGDVIDLSCAEVMDKDGNFYTENYRSAKANYHYICKDGRQTAKARLTFFGFRYIRVNEFPGGPKQAAPEHFTAVVLHSDIKRTGTLSCSNPLLNRLFNNIIWGQKDNFADVPTDCPQRDERLGWTGDAQVFVRTACLNYDVEKFFTKWLADLAADQTENGLVNHVIPAILDTETASAAWGDAATICPWTVYLSYGNPQILKNQFPSMCKWVDYITSTTETPYLWIGGSHFGDWLGLDAPSGSCKGSTRDDFIASAYYAYSTSLVVKAGHVLGEDVSVYEELYDNIIKAFQKAYPTYTTQTECVLAAHFKLASDCQAAADQLADMVKAAGTKLQTGFVGTPYLLHVLSDYGHTKLAYSLLLREEYPSWLYPVTKGATTIWEHWDGLMEDGSFWSSDMNSFNHYAYGSVADWVYSTAAGIQWMEDYPGYEKVRIAPLPDPRLDYLTATLDTRHGHISSHWKKEGKFWRYEITTPVETEIVIAGKTRNVTAGRYVFFQQFSQSEKGR